MVRAVRVYRYASEFLVLCLLDAVARVRYACETETAPPPEFNGNLSFPAPLKNKFS